MTEANDVDVLIVGSGPAGSTYARVISDARPDARILVVEVGPRLSDRIGEHVLNLDDETRVRAQHLAQGPDAGKDHELPPPVTDDRVDLSLDSYGERPGLFTVRNVGERIAGEVGMPMASMSSGVGGMGVHWSVSCPRFIGSERSPLVPTAEFDDAFDAAEKLLNVRRPASTGSLSSALRDRLSREFDSEVADSEPVGFMPTASQRSEDKLTFSGTSAILGDVLTRAGVELRAETLARRILISGTTVVGAELEDRTTGRRYTVRANRVVVAADSFRTPQLLFASGIRPKALGRYLNEHFQMFAFATLDDELLAQVASGTSQANWGHLRVPFADGRPFQGQLVSLAGVPGSPGLDEMPASPAVTVWYASKDIRFDDAVEFSDDEEDFYGMPAMNIRYAFTEKDHRTLESLKAMCARTAAAVGSLVAEPAPAPVGTSLHYQGTVRMGATDDGTSVCDPFLRVWGVEHLYVGGNGVIETATAANPTLTSVALAYRAALNIAASLDNTTVPEGALR